jgi:succinylglutamate desuccinylase
MSQNFAKCGRQHVRDVNLWLQEVNVEIAVLAHEPEDDATLIRSVQQTIAWSNFRV